MAESKVIKQYLPEGVVDFMDLFMERMTLLKNTELKGDYTELKGDYNKAKNVVLDSISDELETPKKEFEILMSGLEVICDWELWYSDIKK
jgi:hypothetical protein